jgi:hypothetical protein
MKQGNSHRFVTQELPPGTGGKPVKLVFCDICDGTPGKKLKNGIEISRSLTSECSGSKHTSEQISAIADGKLDFRGGKWIKK